MKRYIILLLFVVAGQCAWGTPAEILLLRHGEKPESHSDVNLSERGRERARELSSLLTTNPVFLAHGLPVALYAPQASPHGHGRRPEQTLEPLAEKLHLRIQTPVAPADYATLARQILKDPALDGKTVVICWVHEFIPEFAEALGVRHKLPRWKEDVYDRVWVIKYEKRNPKLTNVPQRLLQGDSKR